MCVRRSKLVMGSFLKKTILLPQTNLMDHLILWTIFGSFYPKKTIKNDSLSFLITFLFPLLSMQVVF